MVNCELPEFYTHSEPIARKAHDCCECDAPILKGETHFRCRGKWHGSISVHRQHLACMEACMILRDMSDGECIGFGTLKEEFKAISFDNWYPSTDRHKEGWQQLRNLMAQILRRERRHEREPVT